MWIVSEKGEMEGGGARKKNKFIFKMEIAEKSRTDERKEVSEVSYWPRSLVYCPQCHKVCLGIGSFEKG